MKKLLLAFIASFMVGTSLYAGATGIEVNKVMTSDDRCPKAFQWDYVQESQNVTYNAQAGFYVTNSCHGGPEGIMDVVVWGTNINKNPVVGLAGDLQIVGSVTGVHNGQPYKLFRYYQDSPIGGAVNGLAKAFYSEGNGVLSSMDRFLRNP